MIQLRNVPDALHRTLKARAAKAEMSLSRYLLREIREIADRPTMEELRQRVARRKPVKLPLSAADMIQAERASRESKLAVLISANRTPSAVVDPP